MFESGSETFFSPATFKLSVTVQVYIVPEGTMLLELLTGEKFKVASLHV